MINREFGTNSRLAPCIVFDVDGTLVDTPEFDWYGHKEGRDETALLKAKHIKEMAFLYHAVDYLINDPPTWVIEEGANKDWPKDIFFLTARSEDLRESTVQNLCELTKDAGSSVNKRLLMRPSYANQLPEWDSYNTKTFLLKKLKERGYAPTMVFDNDVGAVLAFIEAGVNVVNRVHSETVDKENAV